MKLFEDKPTYLFGQLYKNKFITPKKTYTLQSNFNKSYIPARFNNKLEIFYSGTIFNSYVLSKNLKTSILFSVDNKITITTDDIKENTVYTFITIKETEKHRIAKLYNFDTFFPGKKVMGKLIMPNKIKTEYGIGTLILQNNSRRMGDTVKALLYMIDDGAHYVEIDNPIMGEVELTVSKVEGMNVFASNGFVKGLIMTKRRYDVGERVKCVASEVLLGYYLFEENMEIQKGDRVNAFIIEKRRTCVIVRVGNRYGYLFYRDCVDYYIHKRVKGIVYHIEDNCFVMGQRKAPKNMKKYAKYDLSELKDYRNYTTLDEKICISTEKDKIMKKSSDILKRNNTAKLVSNKDKIKNKDA